MSVEIENVEILVTRTRRLCMVLSDAIKNGFITDTGGDLTDLAHAAMAAARAVEQDADPVGGEDDHLEAQVENDLGDEFSHGLGEIDGGGE